MININKDILDIQEWTNSLFDELQSILYNIARMSELNNANNLDIIRKEAELALKMLDGVLLSARHDSQQKLSLDNIGIGSILHETAYELKNSINQEIFISNKANASIQTNSVLLKNLIFSVGYYIHKSDHKSSISLVSYGHKKKSVTVAVLSKDFQFNKKDLKTAFNNKSHHMPTAKVNNQTLVLLAIANNLASMLGTKLSVKSRGQLKGFCISIPKSEQLALI